LPGLAEMLMPQPEPNCQPNVEPAWMRLLGWSWFYADKE